MYQIAKTLLVSSMLAITHARTDDELFGHFEAPGEDNVFLVPTPCFANEDGFGGFRAESSFRVEYYYEMVYNSGVAPVEEMLASFERDSTNFILQSDLFGRPCSEVQRRQGNAAQGISSTPDDLLLEGIPCTSLSGNDAARTCIVIAGAFEVFYNDDGSGSDALKQEFEESIENGMNNHGTKNGIRISNPNIVEVAATEDPITNVGDEGEVNAPPDLRSNPDEGGNSTPLIIGATVGVVLIVGAAALYRSKKAGATSSSGAEATGGANSQGADV